MKNILMCLAFIGMISFQPMPKLTPSTLPSYVAQGKTAIQINSNWNKANEYKWVSNPQVKYLYMSLDEFPELKAKFQINSLPAVLIYSNGKLIKKIEGGVAFKITIPQSEILKESSSIPSR
jgi:hypothetical protein